MNKQRIKERRYCFYFGKYLNIQQKLRGRVACGFHLTHLASCWLKSSNCPGGQRTSTGWSAAPCGSLYSWQSSSSVDCRNQSKDIVRYQKITSYHNSPLLKGVCHEIFDLHFFHDSKLSGPLINRIKYFRIRFRFCRDIQSQSSKNSTPQSQNFRLKKSKMFSSNLFLNDRCVHP